MDSGYDVGPVYDAFEALDCHPIVKLRQTGAVKRGDHKPPTCGHGGLALRRDRLQAQRPRSGVARLGRASPPVDGSRPTGSTR
jgi:hypothetical protein